MSTSDATPAVPVGEFPAPELGQAVSVLLDDGRHTDLSGYGATLINGRVHVVVDDRAIPGRPSFDGPGEITGFARLTLRTTTIAQLEPGWWHIDINVITSAGESRLCANVDPTPCPPDAPLVPRGDEVETGIVLWQEGPVIIHQTAEGTIDDLAILGGSGRTSR